MLEDYYKPFEDFDNAGVKKTFTRVFKESVKKINFFGIKIEKIEKSKLYMVQDGSCNMIMRCLLN